MRTYLHDARPAIPDAWWPRLVEEHVSLELGSADQPKPASSGRADPKSAEPSTVLLAGGLPGVRDQRVAVPIEVGRRARTVVVSTTDSADWRLRYLGLTLA